MRDIREVVRLVLVLESDVDRDTKVQQIKLVRDNGDITPDEALELALEYFG